MGIRVTIITYDAFGDALNSGTSLFIFLFLIVQSLLIVCARFSACRPKPAIEVLVCYCLACAIHYFLLWFTNHAFCTRYSERVLINHRRTRCLLKQFATLGVNQKEVEELSELIESKATFLHSLLTYLLHNAIKATDKIKCPDQWVEFVTALSSSSPVCALIRPDPELHHVIRLIAGGLSSFETPMLHFLQQNCPILLNLIQQVDVPHKVMFPVFMELLERSNAPFVGKSMHPTSDSDKTDDGYFPSLSVCQHRRCYNADTAKASKICTKHGTAHPTLLPGIFTLFCSHGL